MKQNVISILVDSVVWECTGTTRAKVSATPFLDSLKHESIIATKLYSHGPYTDAATKSLYTGRNTLDDYSFFYKLNSSPINHFQLFHDGGYETYGIYYPYYMYGPGMQLYIDHSFYTSHFIFASEWNTFMFFAKIIEQRELNVDELKLLRKRMTLMFNVWIHFYEDIIFRPDSMTLLEKPYKSSDVTSGLNILKKEFELFIEDKNKYICNFLKGGYHVFDGIDTIDFDSLMDRRYIDNEIIEKYKYVFKKAAKLNRKANRFSLMPSPKRILNGLCRFVKTKNVDEIKFIANYWYALRPIEEMKKQIHLHEWQCLSSAQMQMDLAIKLLSQRSNEKPFYLSMHVLEPHNYISCFTYDKNDPKLHREEMKILDDYLEAVNTGFKGSVLFFLSLRYVDYCIEKFCNKLKQMELWDNTTLLVVADHGSSYTFNPLHGARVNNFDDECYHIPMMIRSPKMKAFEFNHFCNSKDVLPTLMDIVGLPQSPHFKGHSMLNNKYSWPDYVMTEYAGPGCPEVRGRRLWFSVRNKEFMVAYKVAVYENFEDGELVEVHDLKKDPNCYYNLAGKIDKGKIISYLELIRKRFEEVKKDSKEFIDNL